MSNKLKSLFYFEKDQSTLFNEQEYLRNIVEYLYDTDFYILDGILITSEFENPSNLVRIELEALEFMTKLNQSSENIFAFSIWSFPLFARIVFNKRGDGSPVQIIVSVDSNLLDYYKQECINKFKLLLKSLINATSPYLVCASENVNEFVVEGQDISPPLLFPFTYLEDGYTRRKFPRFKTEKLTNNTYEKTEFGIMFYLGLEMLYGDRAFDNDQILEIEKIIGIEK